MTTSALNAADILAIAHAAADDLAALMGANVAIDLGDDSQPVDLAALAAEGAAQLGQAAAESAPRARRPGGVLAARPLHVIFLLDVSGSMEDHYGNRVAGERYGAGWDGAYAPQVRRIDALNEAMTQAVPAMQRIAADNPEAAVLVSIATFSDYVNWRTNDQPIESLTWTPVGTEGSTSMGRALREAADRLSLERIGHRALPPLVVMVSDGQPTDDFEGGLAAFQAQPWAVKAVKVAVAVPGASEAKLAAFTGDPALVLRAERAGDLVEYIKWASTAALKAASSPASQAHGADFVGAGNVPIPAPPAPQGGPASAGDVW